MPEGEKWIDAACRELNALAGQVRVLSTHRDGLLLTHVFASAFAQSIREASRESISSDDALRLFGAFTICRNELATFNNERVGRGTIPVANRFAHVRQSLPTGSPRSPKGLGAAIDRIDVELQPDVLSTLTEVMLFVAGLRMLPFADDTARADIMSAASSSIRYPELLLLIPQAVQDTIAAEWSIDEITSAHQWVRESAHGRETAVIGMRAAVAAAHATVLRSTLRAVRCHDATDLAHADAALCSLLDFFASTDRRAIPQHDHVRFDGSTNYISLLDTFLTQSAAVYYDADHRAVLDVPLQGRAYRFFLIYPDGCDPFSDIITYERQDAFRAHPLSFSITHRDQLARSALVRFVDAHRSRLHALAGRYGNPIWLNALSEAIASQEYVTAAGVSKAATISLTSLALHELVRLDPIAIAGVDIAMHLILDALFEH